MQIGLFDTDLFIMKGKSSIILDFGKKISGGFRFLRLDLLNEDGFSGMNYLTQIAVEKIKEFLLYNSVDPALCDNILYRLKKDKRRVNSYKQVAGLGAWAGDASQNNEEVLIKGGAKGMSTFISYPILSGVAKCGEPEYALTMLKDYYGGMLSVGATSFWEDFDVDWLKNCSRIDELPSEEQKDIHGDFGAFWCV